MNAQKIGLRCMRFPATLVLGVFLSWLVMGEVPQNWAQESAQSTPKNDNQDNDDRPTILDEVLWAFGWRGDFIKIFGPLFGDIWGENAEDEKDESSQALSQPMPTRPSILDYQSAEDKISLYGLYPGVFNTLGGPFDLQNSSNTAGNTNQASSQGAQGSNSGSSVIACPGQKESEVATLGINDPPAKFRISLRCLCHESFAKVQNAWNHINEKAQGVAAAAKGQTATGQSFAPPSPVAQPAVFEEVNQSLENFTTKTLVSDLMQTYSLSVGGIIVVKAKEPGVEDSEKQYCLDGKGIIDLVQAMEPTKKQGQEQLKKARARWNAEQQN